jgi:lipopolysaccharide/colanic/teichoic acid biosynthesis glycosyltransferase
MSTPSIRATGGHVSELGQRIEQVMDGATGHVHGPSAGRHATAVRLDNPLWYRVIEIAVASLCLALALPVILVLMLIVKLESPGPALFTQERIARGARRPFRFVKLRTMYIDAPTRFPDLCAYSFKPGEVASVKLSLEDDPRVTRFGKWLRRTSLDELPNLWNVVTGDMALVGPRPEMWKMLPYYDGRTLRKFDVLPGVTGFAQVSGRGDLTFAETVEHDLAYVERKSVATDLRTIWRTIGSILRRDGAF